MLDIKTINDLNQLIEDKVEENIHLDYKAAGALDKNKKKEITKDVSAFANSDGGTIIYGISEYNDKEHEHLPEKIDPVDRLAFSKESLEQIINGISPRITGIEIIPITIDEKNNEAVYVVNIPKSDTVHQNTDFCYYKRFNFLSTKMHDYEIKDVFNRTKYPKLQLEFEIIHEKHGNNKFIFLVVSVRNIGNVYVNYVNCYINVPKHLLKEGYTKNKPEFEINHLPYKKLYLDNTHREPKGVEYIGSQPIAKYWPSRYEPILPGLRMELVKYDLGNDFLISNTVIYWELYADNAPVIKDEIKIKDIPLK